MDGPGRDAEWRLPSEGKLGEMVLQAEKHQSQMSMRQEAQTEGPPSLQKESLAP